MKPKNLFITMVLLLSGCYYGAFSSEFGNCRINYYDLDLNKYFNKRAECQVNGNQLTIQDIDGYNHTLSYGGSTGSYTLKKGEFDDQSYSASGTISRSGDIWILYSSSNNNERLVQVILDFN